MADERTLIVVVSGLSGAGKSTAVHALEDVGFFCIDNLPTPAVKPCLDALAGEGMRRIALGMDVRVRSFLEDAVKVVDALEEAYKPDTRVLFLDASDQALLRRYSSTRRPHPLSMAPLPGRERAATAVLEGIQRERHLLSALRARASIVLDTSELSVHDLRAQIVSWFRPGAEGGPRLRCRFLSFGYKYGSPVDADLVLDVRFLKNPYFETRLRAFSGLDEPVRSFVLAEPDAAEFARHAMDLLRFCVPRFEREGKSYLTIAVGCTGGRHRSVVLAEHLAEIVGSELKMKIDVVHRDVNRHTERVAFEQSGDYGKGER